MAMHDTRWFRDGDQWWVARVLTAGAVGWGDAPAQLSTEGVFFRQLGEESTPLRRCTFLIAGELNHMSHASLVRTLRAAEHTTITMYIGPANIPNPSELPKYRIKDEEGLDWTYRPATMKSRDRDGRISDVPAVELICLDDSALRGFIELADDDTLNDVRTTLGDIGLIELMKVVKAEFPDLGEDLVRHDDSD
jgi:hypothetical protein